MTLRKWFRLFWTTLLVGVAVTIAVRTVMLAVDPEVSVWDGKLLGFNVLTGLTYSVLSQMGFFAYLIVNYIALGIFQRRRNLWLWLQWIAVLLGFGYLAALRAPDMTDPGTWTPYLPFPLLLLAASAAVAYWKSVLTRRTAFIPTLFFLFVVTALEAVPALRQNAALSTLDMVIPLFACNAFQILQLHKYVESAKTKPAEAGG